MSQDATRGPRAPAGNAFIRACLLVWLVFVASSAAAHDGLPSFQRYGLAQGLSQTTVRSIAEDGAGFLWIGTDEGLNRFDGYTFTVWRHEHDGSVLANGEIVLALESDSAGNLWVLTPAGVDFYDPRRERLEHVLYTNADRDIPLHLLTAFAPDDHGGLWFGFRDRLSRYRLADRTWQHLPVVPGLPRGAQFVTSMVPLPGEMLLVSTLAGPRLVDIKTASWIDPLPAWLQEHLPRTPIVVRHRAPDGSFLLLTTREQYRFDPVRERVVREGFKDVGLSATPTAALVQRNGDTWVATTAGLYHREADARRYRHYRHSPLDPDGLPGAYLTALHEDHFGNVWIGSDVGALAKFSAAARSVSYYRDLQGQHRDDGVVALMAAMADGTLVTAALSGRLMKLQPDSAELRSFAPGTGALSGIVAGIAADRAGSVWLATRDGLIRRSQDGTERDWRVAQPDGAPSVNAWNDVQVDAAGNVWLLSRYNGLFTMKAGQMRPVPLSTDMAQVEQLTLTRLYVSRSGELFLAGDRGELLGYHPASGRWRRLLLPCAPARHLRIYHVHETADAELLLSSNGGLIRRGIKDERCHYVGRSAGLPGSTVNAALSDDTGRIWLSTNHGISRYTPDTAELVNFSASDGLHTGEFVAGSALRMGRFLYFGSANGIARIDPATWRPVGNAPAVQLTGLSINFTAVAPGSDELLPRALMAMHSLTLPRDRNSIAVRFAASDFGASADYQYSYRLLGFHDRWIDSNNLAASFTGLDPGHYLFEVRARRAPFGWGKSRQIAIEVLPAWWERPLVRFAFGLGAALALSAMWLARSRRLQRLNQHLERMVAERTHEIRSLQEKRSRLFMNISHELRTPLTLVLGPLADLLREPIANNIRQRLLSMERNARWLLRLVDSVLLLARLHDEPARARSEVSVALAAVLHSMLETYQIIARRAKVRLTWEQIDRVSLACDYDWPQIVFSNLISNAIKYTDPGGSVTVSLRREGGRVRFSVMDTGIGIAPEAQAQIFEPFFRIRNSARSNELLEHSSGIGLAHVKEIVERLSGHIEVRSQPGEGTTVCVLLPIDQHVEASSAGSMEKGADLTHASVEPEPCTSAEAAAKPDRPHLLIVEDCNELAQYLLQLFAKEFECVHVASAEEAEPLAFEHLPDIVLSDIRLPGANGLHLAKQLKTDLRTSHIPVILLTGLPDHEVRLEGLRFQADDYLEKPFDAEELRLRVRNQLHRRQALRQHFQKELLATHGVRAGDPRCLGAGDNLFLRKLDRLIDARLDDPALDIHALCESLHLSAKQIQRKVRSLSDLTPTEYIRHYRLRKAAALLLRGESVSRAAYASGFSSQSYFTTCFRQWTGETPKLWQRRRSQTVEVSG